MTHVEIEHILAPRNWVSFLYEFIPAACDYSDLRTDYGELIIDGPAHRFSNHGNRRKFSKFDTVTLL